MVGRHGFFRGPLPGKPFLNPRIARPAQVGGPRQEQGDLLGRVRLEPGRGLDVQVTVGVGVVDRIESRDPGQQGGRALFRGIENETPQGDAHPARPNPL